MKLWQANDQPGNRENLSIFDNILVLRMNAKEVCNGSPIKKRKGASLVAQMVNNLPVTQETQVQSLGGEDPLKEMATHFSILAWRIPWKEKPGRL